MRVLVMGYRAGLIQALRALEIPCVVWSERPVKTRAEHFVRPFPTDANFELEGAFTDVIAGTEAAVVGAAHARRVVEARRVPVSIAMRCHDKLTMKRYLEEHGVPMTDFVCESDGLSSAEIVERLGLPVVVKARASSGGRGIAFAHSAAELDGLRVRGGLYEQYVDAPEMSIETFLSGGRARLVNLTRYREKTRVNVLPAELPPYVEAAVRALNAHVLTALRLTWGMTHLEVYLTESGPLFGEIALRPPGGYIMACITAAWGFPSWRAFAAVELDLDFDFPNAPSQHVAAWILHPGSGRIERIDGEAATRAHPAVKKLKIKAKPGDVVSERVGVGDDIGHVLLVANSNAELLTALEYAQSTLHFEMAPWGSAAAGD